MTTPSLRITPINHPIHATVRVPGSKSLTNRALLIAALAEGTTRLTNALFSDDSKYFAQALQTLGFDVQLDEASHEMTVTQLRREVNEIDSAANARAIDSLLNYETVKYFNNEEYEARRYDDSLRKYESTEVKNEASLGVLNIGQSAIIAVAVTLLVWRATVGVVEGSMTLGDLVLVILLTKYEPTFAVITVLTLVCYIAFTVVVTNWRTHLRREANELDSAANTRAIDSLLNYETVKYFNNEDYEARRYDAQLVKWEQAQVKSQYCARRAASSPATRAR